MSTPVGGVPPAGYSPAGYSPAGSSDGSLPPVAPNNNRASVIRLVVVVAACVALAIALHGVAVLVVVLALIAMVMLHEAGHFFTAKLSGMKVTEFFLGFGPRLWSIRRGETEYGVKAVPAGGYVRIVGMTNLEQVEAEDEPRSYRQATFPRRLLVGVAGSAMHFVIGFGLLWGMCAFSGLPVGYAATNQVSSLATFAAGKSPAQLAGIRPGDVIVAVDGRSLNNTQLRDAIVESAGRTLDLTVLRAGEELTLHITPVPKGSVTITPSSGSTFPKSESASAGVIGVDFGEVLVTRTWNPLAALVRAGSALGAVTAETGQGIAQVFSFHGLGNFVHQVADAGSRSAGSSSSSAAGSSSSSSSSNNSGVLSIYGAARVATQAAQEGVSQLLYILVAINLFVGMVNLFPMLPLDGGHVLIACYERLRSRRGRRYHADVAKLMPVAYLFLALILLIGLGALYANLLNPPNLG